MTSGDFPRTLLALQKPRDNPDAAVYNGSAGRIPNAPGDNGAPNQIQGDLRRSLTCLNSHTASVSRFRGRGSCTDPSGSVTNDEPVVFAQDLHFSAKRAWSRRDGLLRKRRKAGRAPVPFDLRFQGRPAQGRICRYLLSRQQCL